MNYCTSCGNELPENASFCTACGTKVVQDEASNTHSAAANSVNQSVTSDEVKETLSSTLSSAKESVQKNQYFNYFVETAKQPTSALGSTSQSFGWIQLVLLAAVTTFSIYSIFKGLIKVGLSELGMSSMLGMSSSVMGAIRNELVPRVFLASLVVYLTFVVSAFLILKFTAKSEQSFNHLLTEFGGLFTPNIAILFVTALLTTLLASPTNLGISGIILIFSFLLCFAAYNFYLYSRASIDGLDKMYVLLISNLVVLLILGVLVYIQIEPMITMIDQIDSMINGYRW